MNEVSREEWRRFAELTDRAEALVQRDDRLNGAEVTELCRLHRSASRALAQAVADDQPYARTRQLHDLVGRAHAVLYGVEKIEKRGWRTVLFEEAPRALYQDRYLRFSAALFFGLGLVACGMALVSPEWSDMVLGQEAKDMYTRMYSDMSEGRDPDEAAAMTGFYIKNNLTVALRCFAYGVFLGIGSLIALSSNALMIGTTFGHMIGGPYRDNFLSFVTGHAVFELTAIAMAGAAGLRLGLSVIDTGGWTRLASLRREAQACVPVISATCLLLFFAALIEAFLSPMPYPVRFKLPLFLVSFALMVLYIGVLGRRSSTS